LIQCSVRLYAHTILLWNWLTIISNRVGLDWGRLVVWSDVQRHRHLLCLWVHLHVESISAHREW
jgi:hypothetical protein